MKFLAVFTFLLLSTALAACQPAVTADRDQLIQQGEQIYSCHHPDGSGYRNLFPTLAGNPLVTLHDPIPIVQVILDGRGSMPAFRGQLTSEEVAAVLTYIRNAWGNQASAVPPRQVRD